MHRAHTSGFCSALEQLSHSVALLLSLSAAASSVLGILVSQGFLLLNLCGLCTWRQQRGYQQGCCSYDGGSNGSLSALLLRRIPSAILVCNVFVPECYPGVQCVCSLIFLLRYSYARGITCPHTLTHVLRRNCASCKKALWTVVDQLQRCEPLKTLSQMGVITQWTRDQCAHIEVAPTWTRLFLCA